MSYVDFMGETIELGDTIVYPTRRRSDMSLKKAVVSCDPAAAAFSILPGIQCTSESGRRLTIKHPDRCIVVEKAKK